MRKTLMILAILIVAVALDAMSSDRVPVKINNQLLIAGDEPLPNVPYKPIEPGIITDSPGEIVGGTQYDYQTNGSSGRRIALDSQGGVHFAWMNGTSYPTNREVDFNYVDAQGNWLAPGQGMVVSQSNGAGYVQIDLTTDDRAAVAYHQWNLADYTVLAVDAFPGMGIFEYFDVPDMLSLRCYWPYVAVDRNDNIHIVINEQVPNAGDPGAMGYTRSVDGGQTWSNLVPVDTLMSLSAVVVSSPVSDKVAIAYTHPRNYDDQTHNDVYFIESQDGLTWPWRNGKVNVTQYGGGETYWAYIDIAAAYDYNDNLNLVWNAFTSIDDALYYPIMLFHYSTGSEMTSEITRSPDSWPESGCNSGVWNLEIAKMSISVQDPTNALYVVYTGFDSTDCSAGGYANGDLYVQSSLDGGMSWTGAENITNSPSPGCVTGECDSDHWSSAAAKVDEFLRIVYINDKDAGGIPQSEGNVTDNPVLYLEYPTVIIGVDDNSPAPRTFTLSQNYPNPFNAETTIGFELDEQSRVRLAVYDITGALVELLHEGNLDAGVHSMTWKADDAASGLYCYSLSANGEISTKKMILLK